SPDVEEARSALSEIISSAQRADKVLDDFRILYGKAGSELEPVDVNEVLLKALRVLHAELNDHRVAVRVELTSEPPLVLGHSSQLQEVIMNLIRNAIESMEEARPDGRLLEVRTTFGGGETITVEVKDSGPGIDPADLERIFDPFVTTKPHGTGL